MYQSDAGGCCDCGDPTSWLPSGFCPRHRPPLNDDTPRYALPEDEAQLVRGVLRCVMTAMGLQMGLMKLEATLFPLSSWQGEGGGWGYEGRGGGVLGERGEEFVWGGGGGICICTHAHTHAHTHVQSNAHAHVYTPSPFTQVMYGRVLFGYQVSAAMPLYATWWWMLLYNPSC